LLLNRLRFKKVKVNAINEIFMQVTSDHEKLAQFSEFFSIEKRFNVNITNIAANSVQSYDEFINNIPLPFKLASDVVAIDQAALRPIKSLSSVASQLVDFLNLQSQKIELLVTYILSQQDAPENRYQGIKFGGGGIVFQTDKPFALGDILEMKLFLLDEHCAVFCYGEVVAIAEKYTDEKNRNENCYFEHQVIFHFIREEDRELLVKASLHEQAKQLKNLAKHRHQASTSN
jgi:Tfp pilus assembly protein PilZ